MKALTLCNLSDEQVNAILLPIDVAQLFCVYLGLLSPPISYGRTE